MSLTDDQKAKLTQWVADGASLADVQKRLASEFSLSLTYMDTRFLLDDLNLTIKDVAKPSPHAALTPVAPPTGTTASGTATPGAPPALGTPPTGASSVRVVVDKVVRPGAVVSGSVTFSDAQTADWYLDQQGRLGLVPKVKGYQPNAADVQEFQYALQDELARLGY